MTTKSRDWKYKKQADHRRRLRDKGLCPHCGQPCAPYYECAARRERKRLAGQKTELRRAKNRPRKGTHRIYEPRGPRRLWTEVEDDTLRAFVVSEMPLEEMARYFKRTETAVAARIARHI